jgi:hypothetical protein
MNINTVVMVVGTIVLIAIAVIFIALYIVDDRYFNKINKKYDFKDMHEYELQNTPMCKLHHKEQLALMHCVQCGCLCGNCDCYDKKIFDEKIL